MKAFIFDPLWDELATPDMLHELEQANVETVVIKEVAPLSSCKELFTGDDERILCLNPDYVSWTLTSDEYKDIPNLKAILAASTSTSWIDATHATENGIAVCDIKNFSTEAVAEWAITMMFNVARQTPRLIKDSFPLDFDKDFMKYRGIELHGKKVGIVGLGHIGSAIADRCAGLGMEVIYWSHSPKQTSFQSIDLADLISESDVIFPTMELNDETKTILNDDLLSRMKNTAIFISIVHGLFSEELITEMVKDNKLFGFGFEAKPGTFNNYDGNIWAAPSYAWATDSTMHNSTVKWVENMVDAAAGKYPNKVN